VQKFDWEMSGERVGELFVGGDEVGFGMDGESDIEGIVDGAVEGESEFESRVEEIEGRDGGKGARAQGLQCGMGGAGRNTAEADGFPKNIGEFSPEKVGNDEAEFAFGVAGEEGERFGGKGFAGKKPFGGDTGIDDDERHLARSWRCKSSEAG
jgi:hypothetical protein